mmetsp:Transcript_11413/g.70049  ORF Transcript_11413/g.70049 Transcript_11413/m.70049 type:complete len:96 (+) Transcript_11413:268-555(+)
MEHTEGGDSDADRFSWRLEKEQGVADEVDTHVQEGELEPTHETLGVLDVGQEPSHVGRREETECRKGHGKVEPVRSAVMQAPGESAHSNTYVVVE